MVSKLLYFNQKYVSVISNKYSDKSHYEANIYNKDESLQLETKPKVTLRLLQQS